MLQEEVKNYLQQTSHDIISDVPTIDDTTNSIPQNLLDIINELINLFSGDLNPVALKAQRKVLLPTGLNLDEYINTPPDDSSSSSEDEKIDLFVSNTDYGRNETKTIELSEGELEKIRIARQHEQNSNPNYLKSKDTKKNTNGDGCEDIPIAELNLDVPIQIHCKFYYFFLI